MYWRVACGPGTPSEPSEPRASRLGTGDTAATAVAARNLRLSTITSSKVHKECTAHESLADGTLGSYPYAQPRARAEYGDLCGGVAMGAWAELVAHSRGFA